MDRNPGRVRERGDSPAGDRLSHQTDADYADRALLTELMLTPKPGLVDRRNCGTHRDMDVQTFLASARAIAPWWPRFVEIGYACAHIPACDFLPLVRPAGVLCEQAMLQAMDGVNTHKGAIFSLGLLCAAAGRKLLREGGALAPDGVKKMAAFDDALIARHLSPGGSADLLAVTWFLVQFPTLVDSHDVPKNSVEDFLDRAEALESITQAIARYRQHRLHEGGAA